MKNLILIATLLSSLPQFTLAQSSSIQVDGGILLEETHVVNPKEGTMQWTGSDLLVWNGFKWISLINGSVFDSQIKDIDENVYPVIRIMGMEIMGHNLRTTRYRNGDPITPITDPTSWSTQGSGAWCWYENNPSFNTQYGKLYNWYAATDLRGICPEGWHVLSKDEWSYIIGSLGGDDVAGGKMKQFGNAGWALPNNGASNESNLSIIGGGLRTDDGQFNSFNTHGYQWSRTENPTTHGYFIVLFNGKTELSQGISLNKKSGMSIRCIKDQT